MSGDVAILHDQLASRGGAERVACELARTFDAPILAAYVDDDAVPDDVDARQLFDGAVANAVLDSHWVLEDAFQMARWEAPSEVYEFDTLILNKNNPAWTVFSEHQTVVWYAHHTLRSLHDLDRLVVHLIQPHCPFRSRPAWFDRDETDDRDGWRRVRDGDLPADQFWSAYEENLRWALNEVDRLRRSVGADLLLTSDHGNGMGEWGVWSHPDGVHTPSLRRVPFVTVQGTDELDATPTVDQEDRPMTDTVDERLEALGYA